MVKQTPFYISHASKAKISDLSGKSIKWFVDRAKRDRNFAFSGNDVDVLKQLSLEENSQLLNSALMLFGIDPQRFCPNAVIKCSHYYGIEKIRPIPSYQVFEGTLFQQIDAAIDFVMSKLDRSIGSRQDGPMADVRMEIPKEVITEIIVNAVVHRDYDSSGSVQITILADRVEIVNPGRLPEQLTVDDLSKEHLSIPVNPFLARPFFLVGYIEQLGFGTKHVIDWCKKAQLPEPSFEELNQQFRVTIWRNWLTDQKLKEFDLNDRQKGAIQYLKSNRRITNSEYQKLFDVAKRTASKDLQYLQSLELIKKQGTTGKGVYYHLAKGAPKGH